MKHTHLSLADRITISQMLSEGQSFKKSALAVGKNCNSISREVRAHLLFKKTGGYGRPFNACTHRRDCSVRSLCTQCPSPKKRQCSLCAECNSHCQDFERQECPRLEKPPYVCNGCPDRARCTLEKRFYDASSAHEEYRELLSECRSGISYTEEEIRHLDRIVSPLVLRGQSLNHICANNRDVLMVSESTLCRLVGYNVFQARNIDLPRKVRYSRRKKKKQYKVDKGCRVGRTCEDYLRYRDANDSQSVLDIFERLYLELRPDIFMSLMPLILTDNGSEFSNPGAIEYDRQGNGRTRIFYCGPSSPDQKGSAEKNHEFIRYVLPKGCSFDGLTQKDISLLIDHINSYSRESLGNRCPYEMFGFLYGQGPLDALGCHRIPPDRVELTPSLLGRQGHH